MLWQPTVHQFNELFNNEYVLNIMVVMNNKTNKSITPSELSDIIKVHISTAKKYLELLTKYNFSTKETLTDRLGHPTLYTLTTTNININLSLNSNIQDSDIAIDIWNPHIREVKNISDIATYITDDNDLINEIKLKTKTKARRFVTLSFELSKNERLFMKYLPFSTQDSLSVIKICNKAKILSIIDMKLIENFVKKLLKYNIIEIVYD